MDYEIKRANMGDEDIFAFIQTESWKSAFKGILNDEILEKYTQIDKATAMYRRIISENIGNGYLLTVDGAPHCIAWWDSTREIDMPGYAELICIHSLENGWRRGYGSKMMDVVLCDIAKAGYSKVMLWVFEENTRARRFYESIGFTLTEKKKQSFESTEVCYEMTL